MNGYNTRAPVSLGSALCAAVAVIALGAPALAKVPAMLKVQGRLMTAGGGAVTDGDYFITFALYPAPVGGAAVWSEGPVKVAVSAGRLTHDLGSVKALSPGVLAKLPAAWLGMTVGTDPELTRQRVGSVAYALLSASAEALSCTGCLGSTQIAPGALGPDKLSFTWAGSKTKGGPATSALDLKCTGCVGLDELKLDGDLDLGGNALKAKMISAGSVAAGTVAATSFAGDGSKLTGIQTVSGTCAKSGEAVVGIAPDGKLKCAPTVTEASLPPDALDEVSNKLLTNEFVHDITSAAAPKPIPDNNPIGVFDEITFPDLGTAKSLVVHLSLKSPQIADLDVVVFDPDNTPHTLFAGGGKGQVLKGSWPTPDKPVKGDLLAWEGKNPKGKWRLKVVDNKATPGGDGQIVTWGVKATMVSAETVRATGLLQSFGGLQLQAAAKPPVKCDKGTLAYIYYNTTTGSLEVCNGKAFFAFSTIVPPGSKGKPAKSCVALLAAVPGAASGLYWLDPNGGNPGDAVQVWCDMKTDGGGWAMVVTIDGNDEDHSNVNQVGSVPVKPDTANTSKFKDAFINQLIGQGKGASIRFICDGTKHFFKGCQFRATKGLPSGNSCVTSYSDQGATKLQNTTACNVGSGALGCHCNCASPASHTYCSHCDGADGAGSHNRKGCGHDATGYSKKGSVWVR